MDNRRTFLKQAGLGVAAAYLAPSLLSCAPQRKSTMGPTEIGLQLFTLREQLADDAVATLARVAEIGYDHVETFGLEVGTDGKRMFWDLDIPSLSDLLTDNQLNT